MTFLTYMFAPQHQPWYTGAIWSNVLQGLIFLVPSVWVVLRKLERHHKEEMEQRERHQRQLVKAVGK